MSRSKAPSPADFADDAVRSGWRFGPYELYPVLGRLVRGSRIVPLTRIDLQLITLLVEYGGEVVPREVFFETVWPGRPVEDANLTSSLHRIRRELGKGIVNTAHGSGYFLGYAVEPLGTAEEYHALYLTKLFITAGNERQRMRDIDWDRLYLPKLDELRSALDWSLAKPERKHIAISLAGASARLWERASLVPEGRRYLDRAEQLIDGDISPAAAARVLYQHGLLWREADRPRALAHCERAAAICRMLGDKRHLAELLGIIGDAHLFLGQHEQARIALEESEKLLSVSDQSKSLWNVLNCLGLLASIQQMPKEAMNYFNLARDLAKLLDDSLREHIIVLNIGELEFAQGALDRAVERAREAAEGLRSAPMSYRVRPIVNLALYQALRGNLAEARKSALEALPMLAEEGGFWLRVCLQVWAYLMACDGQYVDAGRLLGFVDAQYVRFGEARQKPGSDLFGRLMQKLTENLTADSIEVWRGEGALWTETQATEYVQRLLRKNKAGKVTT